VKGVSEAPNRGFSRLLQVPSMVLKRFTVGKLQSGASRTSAQPLSCHKWASSSFERKLPGLWNSSSASSSALASALCTAALDLRFSSDNLLSAFRTICSYSSCALPIFLASSEGRLKNFDSSCPLVYFPSLAACKEALLVASSRL